MPGDPGLEMKARLRADLRVAMKHGRTAEANLIRALVAALDNAEAPTINSERPMPAQHAFRDRSAEIERLLLSRAQVREVILEEIRVRERAAAELQRLGRLDRAEALRAEAIVAERYLER